MKNRDLWKPNRYVYKKGRLRASRNPKEVRISSRLMVDIIAKFYGTYLRQYANGKLLDLGCGKVPLYEVYKDYVEQNVCIDWANTLHKNPYLDYEHDLNEELTIISDSEFDTIILSDVLEHIRKPKELCDEMYRVLNNDGTLLMNVPFYYWLHEDPHDYFRYTQYALRFFMQESGFHLVKLEALGGAPEVLADIFSKLIIHIPLIGKISARIIQNVTWFFINTKIGRKLSHLTSDRFPLVYVLIAKKQ